MKKVKTVLFLSVMIFLFCGCGGKHSSYDIRSTDIGSEVSEEASNTEKRTSF